jgi:hypothetical protein
VADIRAVWSSDMASGNLADRYQVSEDAASIPGQTLSASTPFYQMIETRSLSKCSVQDTTQWTNSIITVISIIRSI